MKRAAIGLAGLLVVTLGCGPKPGYSSPEEAMQALTRAVETGDPKAIATVFGPGGEQIVESGDPVADQNGRERYLADVKEAMAFEPNADGATVAVLGSDKWPFPVPIVEENGRFKFDAAAAQDEIVSRRIGSNELHAIATCRAFAEAQREYAKVGRDGNKPAYAKQFMSTPGKHDGLYWETAEGEPESPMGLLVAEAAAEGYSAESKPVQYHGYLYKSFHSQGSNVSGGAKEFVRKGLMTEGFALVAWPADYGNSGIMTFVINQVGIVFQKDLGEKTDESVTAMTTYDPDTTWQPTSD